MHHKIVNAIFISGEKLGAAIVEKRNNRSLISVKRSFFVWHRQNNQQPHH